MHDHSLSGILVQKYIRLQELEEIYGELGLDEEDQEIVFEFLEQWRPDYDLEYLVKVVEQDKGHPNIEKIAGAAFAIAFRATTNFRQAGGVEPSSNPWPQ